MSANPTQRTAPLDPRDTRMRVPQGVGWTATTTRRRTYKAHTPQRAARQLSITCTISSKRSLSSSRSSSRRASACRLPIHSAGRADFGGDFYERSKFVAVVGAIGSRRLGMRQGVHLDHYIARGSCCPACPHFINAAFNCIGGKQCWTACTNCMEQKARGTAFMVSVQPCVDSRKGQRAAKFGGNCPVRCEIGWAYRGFVHGDERSCHGLEILHNYRALALTQSVPPGRDASRGGCSPGRATATAARSRGVEPSGLDSVPLIHRLELGEGRRGSTW